MKQLASSTTPNYWNPVWWATGPSKTRRGVAHLSAWERRLLQRVAGQPEDGSDLGTPAFNDLVYQENRCHSLAAVRADAGASYAAVLSLAEGLTPAKVK